MKNFMKLPTAMLMCVGFGGMAEAQTAGLDFTNMDVKAAAPGTDFYQYACGGWMQKNPLPAEFARFGTFDQLGENNRKQINELILELSSNKQEKGSVAYKIAKLYNQVMDSTTQNKMGVAPLKADLQRVAKLSDVKQLPDLMAYMQSVGIDVYFSLYVDADPMNSNANLVQTYQSGLGLGNRDYYIDNDSNMVKIRNEYKSHITKMFRLCGFSSKEATDAMQAVMEIETRIAKASYSKVQLRDPHANYHMMSFADLQRDYAGLNWDAYFRSFGLKVDSVSVSQPEPVHECLAIINKVSLKKQKYYLDWCLINEAATSLGDAMYAQNFEFYGKILSGTQIPQPRWKRAVGFVNGSLGEAVGQMYVNKYFPEANKQRMLTLVHNLQTALGERIQGLSWMGDTTKAKAIEKLKAFHIKIGYPDKWRDYSALSVEGNSLWENRKNVSKFNTDYMMAKASKPVDRDEWLMNPQTVNAYYNPSTNEVCFPAGILQYPFFDMSADDAFNYGAIGVVIGHEMTHGFDDQGRQFDKDGNMIDWWTASDAADFTKKAHVMAAFFDSIEVAPGVHANGEFTLGENLADHGGLQISFQAYKKATEGKELPVANGLTADQRFFLAYAGVWANNIRPEEILRRVKMDPHALGRWRVNGALPHIGAWYQAFGITEKDPMYVAPADRVSIW